MHAVKLLKIIEEIRVVLREDFDVQTLQQVIAPGASLELLTALFPLLPSDLKALYQSYKEQSPYDCHSGEPNCDWLFGSVRLLSNREITKHYRYWMELEKDQSIQATSRGLSSTSDCSVSGPVKPAIWRKGWMPLIGERTQFFVCDMDPAAGGAVGQIIFVSIVDGHADYKFKSITEMLEVQLGLLKAGKRDIFEAEDYFT
jgi:cell wall assembly regulator SMI1